MKNTHKKVIALLMITIILISSFAVFSSFILDINRISFKYEEKVDEKGSKDKLNLPVTSGFTLNPEGGENPHKELFYIRESGSTRYIKTVSCDKYDGELWRFTDKDGDFYYGWNLDIEGVNNFEEKIEDEVFIDPINEFTEGFIPVSTYTTSIEGISEIEYYEAENIFYSNKDFTNQYSFYTNHYRYRENVLNNSNIINDEKYLQLPDSISSRIYNLADDITEEKTSPFQKALAIQEYLKKNYEYNADYERSPEDHEPIDWFLFEEKQGVCANFNSALAVLGRASGIPTRMVKGYKLNDTDTKRIVYSDQAHSWVELGLDCGWINFDATPSSSCGNCIYNEEESKIITSIDLQVPDDAYPGEGIAIQAELKNNEGRILSNRNLTLNIDSIQLDGNITDYNITDESIPSKGGVVKSLPYTGRYRITVSYNGSEVYLNSSETETIKIDHIKFNLDDLKVLVRNSDTQTQKEKISGQIFYEGEPIKDEKVRVEINNPDNNTIIGPLITDTDSKGYFDFDYSLGKNLPLGKMNIKYEHLQSKTSKVRTVYIKSIPNINIDTKQTYDKLKVIANIKDELGNDIPNKDVTIYINSTETEKLRENFIKSSNENGRVIKVIKYPSAEYFKEPLDIKVVSSDSNNYVITKENKTIDLEKKNKGPIKFIGDQLETIINQYWYILIIVIFGSIVSLGIKNLIGYRFQTSTIKDKKKSEKEPINISLGQINKNLPYVWIVNEKIDLLINLNKYKKYDKLQVVIDGNKVKEVKPDKKTIEIQHIFKEKGTFEVKTILSNGEKITKKINLEIVDHKKGIQVIYSDLLERLKKNGFDIKEEDTPANIEQLLVERLGYHDSIREIKIHMEKAKYSYHELNRDDFKQMVTHMNILGDLLED